ncbi:MAG: CoA-binding protein [Planctomycetota bacterium]|nr:CoA-binding protein [Planctomycetota bacterium]MDA1140823.1 CoA-binding protein [Planctomycetota bacterium]
MTPQQQIDAFLNGHPHAVVGASRDRMKYGNKVLRSYQQHGMKVFPINPSAGEVEGLTSFTSLSELPEFVHGISIITPPQITEIVVEEAGELGIKHVWMQPGAESQKAVQRATALGMNVIYGGPCLLVVVGHPE